MSASIDDIVAFWRDAGPQRWFSRDDAFDTRFRERFLADHYAAARRDRDAWSDSADGTLALLVLLDQFPRNAFRDTAHMFASDPLALMFAKQAIAASLDLGVAEDLRAFVYMPLMHSESLDDQHACCRHMRRFGGDSLKYAEIHRDVIKRFGRFPHRNPMFGRDTTVEEQAFLDEGGFAG